MKKFSKFIILTLMILLCSPSFAQQMSEKDAKKAQKEFEKSLKKYQKNPQDIDNTMKLASYYAKGYGTHENVPEAIHLYEECADAGNTKAILICGEAYASGMGVEQNWEKAAQYYLDASKLNSKEGKAKYAECLLLGRGVQKNETKGEIILRDEITNGDNDFARILYINYIIQKCGGVSNLLEEKCPKCHGNGVLIRDENHIDRCDRCGGSGQSAYAKYRKEVEMSVRKINSFYSSDLEYLLNISLFFPKEIWPMSFRDVVASEFRKRLVKNAENGDKTAVICIYFFYFYPDEILKPEYDKLIAGYLYSLINQNMFSYEMFNRIKIGVIKAIKEREFSLIPPEWLYHDNNEEYLTINKENKKYWYNEIKSLYCFTDNSEVSYGPSNTKLYSYKPDYQNSIFLEAKSHYDFNNINYDNCWYVYHFVKKYVDGPNNNSRDEKYSYYNTYLKNLNNAANIWMKKAAEIGIQEAIEKYEYYLLHGEFYHREPSPTEQIEYRENHSNKYY